MEEKHIKWKWWEYISYPSKSVKLFEWKAIIDVVKFIAVQSAMFILMVQEATFYVKLNKVRFIWKRSFIQSTST